MVGYPRPELYVFAIAALPVEKVRLGAEIGKLCRQLVVNESWGELSTQA